jgi:hypothetical protein
MLEMTFILTIAIASTFDVEQFSLAPGMDQVEEISRFTMIAGNFYPRLRKRSRPA